MTWRIRPCVDADLEALAAIYRDAIRHLAPSAYTPEQTGAWAAHADDRAAFDAWVRGVRTFVATDDTGQPVGFAGLEPPARVASLFVAPDAMRRGVASALLVHLLDAAGAPGAPERADAVTEASEFSRPLFERFGFRVVEIERTVVRGVEFTRYAMRRGA